MHFSQPHDFGSCPFGSIDRWLETWRMPYRLCCPINADSGKHADKDVDRDLAFKAAFEVLYQGHVRTISD